MGTTTKGYPYPEGTDRVMDGDNAIQSLAEAVDTTTAFTHALPVGQAVPATTVTAQTWQAATEDGNSLTKTSASVWTVTAAGLYVVTAAINLSASQSGRAFLDLYVGAKVGRAVFTADSRASCTVSCRLVVGDTIHTDLYLTTGVTTPAGTGGGFLTVTRVGRSTGSAVA
jgi:hypothetical protein